MDSRRIRYSPSRVNSTAAAACPNDSPPSMPSLDMILASPGTSPTRASSSAAGTSSPDSTVPPSSNLASRPDRSTLPSRERNVSAIARRSNAPSTSSSLPSSLTSNSTFPRSVLTMTGRSHTRATGGSADPASADRRTADAAALSAAAIANLAETPERASMAGDSRTARVNLAITSTRWSGSSAPTATSASCLIKVSSSDRDSG